MSLQTTARDSVYGFGRNFAGNPLAKAITKVKKKVATPQFKKRRKK